MKVSKPGVTSAKKWLVARASERSTWIGLAALGAYFGLKPEAITAFGEIAIPILGAGLVVAEEKSE